MKRLLSILALSAALVTPALAIDMKQPIKTFDGKDFIDETGKPAPQILGTIIENSLLAAQQGDTPEEKNKRFWLALKIHTDKDVTLTPDEIVTIKKALQLQPIAVMGQATRMIDPTFKAPQ